MSHRSTPNPNRATAFRTGVPRKDPPGRPSVEEMAARYAGYCSFIPRNSSPKRGEEKSKDLMRELLLAGPEKCYEVHSDKHDAARVADSVASSEPNERGPVIRASGKGRSASPQTPTL